MELKNERNSFEKKIQVSPSCLSVFFCSMQCVLGYLLLYIHKYGEVLAREVVKQLLWLILFFSVAGRIPLVFEAVFSEAERHS